MNMQQEELRQLLEVHGWGLLARERKGPKRSGVYLFAQRREGKQVMQKYITTLRTLPLVTKEEVLSKISASSR